MEIVNITATVEMKNLFDLTELLHKLPDSQLANRWVKIRIPPFDKYIAFYKSGKFLITGAKTESEIYDISKSVVDYLRKYGIDNEIKNIKINNYVLLDQFDGDINLEDLIIKLSKYNVSYEPEQFPGLIFKDENNVTFLLFNSGKIIITGVKSLNNIKNHIVDFKKLLIN